MDTPERNQIGTPLSKFEESPFSNFVNSLSPINPVKTIHVSQTFSSLSFTSPPSVFTSPHVSFKESRFLRRRQVSDLAKPQSVSTEGNKDSEAVPGTSADQQPDSSTNAQVLGDGASGGKDSTEPLSDVSECATDLPIRVLKYDNVSPNCEKAASSSLGTNRERDTSISLIQHLPEASVKHTFGAELSSQDINHGNEETSCDWQSLISCSTDLFVFDSPNNAATLRGTFQKSLEEETNVYASLLLRIPPDDENDKSNSQPVASSRFSEAHETLEQSTQPAEVNELNQIDQPMENSEMSSMNENVSGDTGEKSGNENFYNVHRGMLRRCLTFEMPRSKKTVDGILFPSSLSSLGNEERPMPATFNKQPIMPRADSKCIFPGIGLHLNALAAASKDCGIPTQEILSPTSQEPPHRSSASASLENDRAPLENGVEFVEDFSHASAYAATEELNLCSPKKKRRKFENTGEGEASCKRCNCKKSKCLKLYCECFAAGVYCVEPCSCQDCFNKPIHEDTVLATRKQIESRNPLAFAPKVIRTSKSFQELGEDSTRTPASARHKRGCNCKKSSCLKKYCECYQGGVGCSINCRCEGCKNAFGTKDGSILLGTGTETEDLLVSEKRILDNSLDPSGFLNDDDQNSEFTLPRTPLRLYRPSVPLPTSSKGKPPRSSSVLVGSSSCLHPVDGSGRSTFLRSQSKIDNHFQSLSADEIPTVLQDSSPPSSGLKTLSPNGKRISPPHHVKGKSLGFR